MEQNKENYKLFLDIIKRLDSKYKVYFNEFISISEYYFIEYENNSLKIFVDSNLPPQVIWAINEAFEFAYK